MRGWTIACVLVCAFGCDETMEVLKQSKEAGPVVIDAAIKTADAGPTEPLFTDKPLSVQLDDEPMASVEFIGWSAGGDLYIIDSKRGVDSGDMAGSRAIELREVRDSRTGELLHAFRIEKAIDDQVEKDDDFRKAWAQAKPMKAYRAFAKERGVIQDAQPPEGAKLSLRVVKKTVPALSRVTARSAGLTQSIVWRSWEKPKNAREKRAKKARDKLDTSLMRPTIELVLAFADKERVIDYIVSEYNVGLISEATNNPTDDTVIDGELAWHWSPDGRRVLYTVNWTPKGLSPEMVQPSANVRVRAAGPQVGLTMSEDERARASELVRGLEAKGLTIAVSFARFTGKVVSSVDYSQAADRAVAESIASAIGAKATKNPQKHWDVTAIVAPNRPKDQ